MTWQYILPWLLVGSGAIHYFLHIMHSGLNIRCNFNKVKLLMPYFLRHLLLKFCKYLCDVGLSCQPNHNVEFLQFYINRIIVFHKENLHFMFQNIRPVRRNTGSVHAKVDTNEKYVFMFNTCNPSLNNVQFLIPIIYLWMLLNIWCLQSIFKQIFVTETQISTDAWVLRTQDFIHVVFSD